jgi:hypothetical protein
VKRWDVLAQVLVLLVAPVAVAQTPEAGSGTPAQPDMSQVQGPHTLAPVPQHRMGVHGMVLFGTGKRLYASHIPMFHRPHDRQLVIAVSLSHPELAAGRDFSAGTYTLEPERFDLDALADGRLKHFKATLHQGNFEGGGTALHRDVTVRVEAVGRVQPLDNTAAEPTELSYWLVGEGKEVYLVHAISRAPDFDQVVKVLLEKPAPRRGKGLATLRFAGRKNVTEGRLRAGEQLVATSEDGQPVRLTVQRELSFLVGPDFTPTQP